MLLNPELHLRIVGVLLLALIALNFYVPRRFNWKTELASLSLVNRQIFQVHAGFICVILTMFAVLVLFFTRDLLEPTRLARAVLAALAIFWFVRLLTQWFVYDRSLWRGRRFETIVHLVFTGVWTYFSATFAYALFHNLGSFS
ncbi:MAG: hypothetical protein QOE14_1863 [Humisphaera sp.]|nr:hypothetical protein [Humisphaera sp.]